MLIKEYHPSWEKFLSSEVRGMIEEIEKQIDSNNICPVEDKVFVFMKNDLTKMHTVIIGQDSYFSLNKLGQPIATGKAFQVDGLNDWNYKFRQTSLRNILRLIYKTYEGVKNYSDIPKFKDITKMINEGDFKIASPYDLFESWEKQGVLLLNASLTCKPNEANSHESIWAPFTDRLIRFIDEHNEKTNWILWGKSSEKFEPLINSGNVFKSRHPMMCSEKYEDDFLKGNCFKELQRIVNWKGIE